MSCSPPSFLGAADEDGAEGGNEEMPEAATHTALSVLRSEPSIQNLLLESTKLQFLLQLLQQLHSEGSRCLIFSQSIKMLDMVVTVIPKK
jgi:SNF2 family DNA or RNA helicase